MNYTDYLIEYYLLEWSNQQIQAFKDKFGEKNFEFFDKAKDRLKDKDYSTDIQYYLSDKFKAEDLQPLLLNLYDDKKDAQKKRIISGTEYEVRGKYNFFGEVDGYLVYQPLDYLASMDLGINTGWCTTGRYKHYGHPEFTPSEKDAKKHFDSYTNSGIEFYYFLNPTTFYGEYALALNKNRKAIQVNNIFKTTDKNGNPQQIYVKNTNYELFNAKDDSIVYNSNIVDICKKLNINIDIDYEIIEQSNGLYIGGKTVFKLANMRAKRIVIPEGILSIEDCAFKDCTGLTSITIPDSVTSISYGAFYNCTGLTSVTIPDSITSIGDYAFQDCSNLTSIAIPDRVASIGRNAFKNCTGLKSVTIPDSVTYIADGAFRNCTGLTSVTIGNSVTSIEDYAFRNCTGLTSITIPNSVTSIEDYAFKGCNNLSWIGYSGNNKDIMLNLTQYADVIDPETGEILQTKQ